MFKKSFAFIAAAAMLSASAPAAFADNAQDFTLHNETNIGFVQLYVEPESNTDSWGEDLLNGDTVQPGEQQPITFPKKYGDECVFGVRAVDKDGNTYDVRGVNLCQLNHLGFVLEGGKMKWVSD